MRIQFQGSRLSPTAGLGTQPRIAVTSWSGGSKLWLPVLDGMTTLGWGYGRNCG